MVIDLKKIFNRFKFQILRTITVSQKFSLKVDEKKVHTIKNLKKRKFPTSL